VLQCGAPAAALLHMADTACKYNVLLTLDYSKVGSCPLALLQEHINMDEVISAIVIVGNPGGMRHARGGGGPAAGEPSGRARSAAASARCVMRS